MSRGFVKEDDLEHAGTDLPERPLSAHPNYVTPQGLLLLEAEASKLYKLHASLIGLKDDAISQQQLANIDRDLRYVSARLEHAILVNPNAAENTMQEKNQVLFGATVVVEDEEGSHQTFIIVGEDEADIAQQKVSYVSPIAKALIGRKIGESVLWQRPAGNMQLEIISITY